jgi:hypothetical protein
MRYLCGGISRDVSGGGVCGGVARVVRIICVCWKGQVGVEICGIIVVGTPDV